MQINMYLRHVNDWIRTFTRLPSFEFSGRFMMRTIISHYLFEYNIGGTDSWQDPVSCTKA